MNPIFIRYAIALVLVGHGIGHVVGYWGPRRESWLLSRWMPESTSWTIEQIWMGITVVLFVAATLSLLDFGVAHTEWRTLALSAAAISTLGIIVFWGTWPESAGYSALAFDLVLIGVLLLLNWPSESAIGFEPSLSGSPEGK